MRRADFARAWRTAVLAGAAALIFSGTLSAAGNGPAPPAEDPALEARMQAITEELRCLVCQNQTVADSHSGLAEDLRREVRAQLRSGASDADVRSYMVERYGDFVLYRPPVKSTTFLLWAGPALLLLAGAAGLLWALRRRASIDPARFETDPANDVEAAPGAHR